MTLVQSSIFDFKPLPKAARWILGWQDKGHAKVCSTDAAAMAGSVGQIPTSGTWLRCLPIEKKAPYNGWCLDWDSTIWWHNSGVRYRKLVRYDGTVGDFLDPWPHAVRYDKESHRYNDVPWLEVTGIRMAEGVITFETSDGEWSAEVGLDAEVKQYDRHPYRPSYDLEHFAIECHRHRIPEGMMAWRAHYVYATAGLSPFYKTSDHHAVFKEDKLGRVAWAVVPNEEYSQICDCARLMGLPLELDHAVPALDNRAMWPIEHTCASCLRRGSANEDEDDPCWKRKGAGDCYHRWMWDRRTPAKGLKEKKGRKCACEEDDDDDSRRVGAESARDGTQDAHLAPEPLRPARQMAGRPPEGHHRGPRPHGERGEHRRPGVGAGEGALRARVQEAEGMMQIKVPRRRVRYEGGYAVIDVPGDGEEMLRALLMAMDSDKEVAVFEGEGHDLRRGVHEGGPPGRAGPRIRRRVRRGQLPAPSGEGAGREEHRGPDSRRVLPRRLPGGRRVALGHRGAVQQGRRGLGARMGHPRPVRAAGRVRGGRNMIVRMALMDDGREFEVPSAAVLGCFSCGYVYGWDAYGEHVLNVAHIVRFGPCGKPYWVKEART